MAETTQIWVIILLARNLASHKTKQNLLTSFSRSGDMKEIQNIKIGRFGVIWAHKVIGNVIIQYSAYDFLFTFDRKYAYVLYCFWDIVSFLSKDTNFCAPCVFCTPLGVTHWNFSTIFGVRKLESVALLAWSFV